MRILLVDDEPGIAGALSAFLRLHGMDVQEAHSYEVASKMLREENWSILISDHNLPDGTGFDLCREFCARGEGVALLLSARSHPSFENEEKMEHFSFLPKPIAPGKLLSWIQDQEKNLFPKDVQEEVERHGNHDPFQNVGFDLQELGLKPEEIDHCLCSLFPTLLYASLKRTEVSDAVIAFELDLYPEGKSLPREAVEDSFPGSDLWLVRDKDGTPIGVQVRVFRGRAFPFEGEGIQPFQPNSFRSWSDILKKMDGLEVGSHSSHPSWLRFGVDVLRREQSSLKENGTGPSLSRLLWTRTDGLGDVEL